MERGNNNNGTKPKSPGSNAAPTVTASSATTEHVPGYDPTVHGSSRRQEHPPSATGSSRQAEKTEGNAMVLARPPNAYDPGQNKKTPSPHKEDNNSGNKVEERPVIHNPPANNKSPSPNRNKDYGKKHPGEYRPIAGSPGKDANQPPAPNKKPVSPINSDKRPKAVNREGGSPSPARPASSGSRPKSGGARASAVRPPRSAAGSRPTSQASRPQSSQNQSYVSFDNNKTPDFSQPRCNVQGFSKTSDYESWLHPSLHKFCHEIVAKLYQANANRNFLMSPVTAYVSVGMLSVGARGNTLEEMGVLLCVKETIKDSIKDASTVLDHITHDKEFKIYNTDGVFVHPDYPIEPAFKARVGKTFNAHVAHANFESSDEAVSTINEWLNKATNSRIKEIVHKTQKNSLLYVCNTTFMRAQWSVEFPKKLTKQGDFHTFDKTVIVDYMNKADTFEYVDAQQFNFEVLFLPYEGQVERDYWEMAILLPRRKNTSLANLAHFIKSKHLRRFKKRVKYTDLDLKLPKFKMTTTIDLMPLMKHYGLKSAFDPASADLTAISAKRGLHVDHLIQKCYISVSEDGTDMAARLQQSEATLRDSRHLMRTNPPPQPFHVSRPFAFCVFQPHSGFILLAGLVVDPHIEHHL